MNIKTFNYLMGFTGLLIIWLSTHNWIAIVGGIVAGIHITFTSNQ